MTKTNNALDLAISGAGMFRLRGRDGAVAYTRGGQFRLGQGGRVETLQGLALQTTDGSDLVLADGNIKILADGTVLQAERPVARIGVYAAPDGQARALGGSLFALQEASVEEVPQPQLRQGMVETSNVALADEMVSMMAALRQAEGGARLVQAYDDLIGKAVSTLGQGTR